MSEETPAILSDHVPEPLTSSPNMGETLRMARERRGLEVEEVARQLRMSLRQVAALEANDIASLPSPTFTRGFIRNYARLLEIDPEPLLAIYRDTLPESAASAASISLHSEEIPILTGNRNTWVSYLVASVILGVAAGAWWAYMDWREKAPPQPVVAVAPPVAPTPAAAPITPQPPVDTSIQDMPVVPVVDAQVTPPEISQPASPAVASSAASRISMKFSQQSWVRVTDRDGNEVFHKNKPENTEDSVEGNPPFKVEIGNAAAVQLSYNGQPIDLTPHTKANVARLTLE